MAELSELSAAIVRGDAKTAASITEQALAAGTPPMDIVSGYMVPAMDEVGRRFECSEFYTPELLLAARAMKSALNLIRPLLAKTGAQPAGRVVIGTVKGDLHDIGKNLVSAVLEGGGFEVTDLGVDVPPDKFIRAIQDKKPDVVCLSALLTTTLPAMKTALDRFRAAGVRDQVKILIGGAPVTADYAQEIGADAYGETATSALALVRQVLARPA